MHEIVVTKEKLYLYEDLATKLRRENGELMDRVMELEGLLDARNGLVEEKI